MPGIDRTVIMGRRMWQQAQRDLESAGLLLQPRTYYLAASCAQQATEEALKAAHWHLRGEEPPWNHRLVEIAERVVGDAGAVPRPVDEALGRL